MAITQNNKNAITAYKIAGIPIVSLITVYTIIIMLWLALNWFGPVERNHQLFLLRRSPCLNTAAKAALIPLEDMYPLKFPSKALSIKCTAIGLLSISLPSLIAAGYYEYKVYKATKIAFKETAQ